MSIQSEITRISNNVQNTIDVIEQTGVSIPAGANSNNLPSLAAALANEKQDKLTGQQGQYVGFDSNGAAVATSKPTYTASEVGARPSTWTPSAADVGAVPTSRTVNGKALSSNITLNASDVGARANNWTPTASEVGAVPTSRTVNGKPLSSNISLTADDVGAANPPALRTATLSASRWSGNSQTVTVQGVKTSGQSVRISPATKTDADNWVAAGVWCSEPTTANQLVFTCDTAPTENININVEIQEVQS